MERSKITEAPDAPIPIIDISALIHGTEARQIRACGSVLLVVSPGFTLREIPPPGSSFPRVPQRLLPHTRL